MRLHEIVLQCKFFATPDCCSFKGLDADGIIMQLDETGAEEDVYCVDKHDLSRNDWFGTSKFPKRLDFKTIHKMMDDQLYPQKLDKFLKKE